MCQFLILDNLSESACIPLESILHPRMSSTGVKGSNFFLLIYGFSTCIHSLCSCIVFMPMEISSNQTCTSSPIQSQNTHIRTCWNVEGALQSPCCITFDSKAL